MRQEETIEQILADLYAIDGNFKAHEEKLRKIIIKMVGSKPEVLADEKFKEKLRLRLLYYANQKGKEKSFWFFQKKWAVSFSLIFLCAALGGGYYFYSSARDGIKISRLKSNAFGQLNANHFISTEGRGNGGLGNDVAAQSENKTTDANTDKAISSVTSSNVSQPIDSIPSLMPWIGYKFKFDGEMPKISDLGLVYKVEKPADSSLSSYIMGLFIKEPLINMGKFRDMKVSYASLYEDRGLGYVLYFYSGGIQVSLNESKGSTMKDSNYYNMNPSEVLRDEELKNISKKFVKEFGIDTTNYGEPEVDNQYFQTYEDAVTHKTLVSNITNVVFPFIIDGKEVYDYSGKYGIKLTIDMRSKKVINANIDNLRHLSSSEYRLSSGDNAVESANLGGINNRYYDNNQYSKTETIDLGEPNEVYFMTGYYDNTLIVPALVFPTKGVKPKDAYYSNNVIVPLVETNGSQSDGGSGITEPMPAVVK